MRKLTFGRFVTLPLLLTSPAIACSVPAPTLASLAAERAAFKARVKTAEAIVEVKAITSTNWLKPNVAGTARVVKVHKGRLRRPLPLQLQNMLRSSLHFARKMEQRSAILSDAISGSGKRSLATIFSSLYAIAWGEKAARNIVGAPQNGMTLPDAKPPRPVGIPRTRVMVTV